MLLPPPAAERLLITQQNYRDAMARLGAAVNVITTNGPAGRHGFTASAVCSVTDSPPTLLVCQNRGSESNRAFKENAVLCVNTLAPVHADLSNVFAGMTEVGMDGRFEAGAWDVLETGSPVLIGATVSFDCRIVQVTEVGTHSVLFAEVVGLAIGDATAGLIYFARGYHHIG